MDAGVQTGRSYLDNHELGLQQELFELYVDNDDGSFFFLDTQFYL